MKAELSKCYVLVVLCVISCLFVHNAQVSASGVFEIRLDEFVNQAGRAKQGECCEGFVGKDLEICDEPCRTAFHICFGHYQSGLGSDMQCTFGSVRTPVLGTNTITPKHSDYPGNNIVGLTFNFTWPKAFSLMIEATHEPIDKTPGKLIARMGKTGNIDANTDWKTETQIQQEKILRYSYRVRCEQHYYGDGCSEYCRPRDDMFGHWTCDRNGKKVCLPGWRSKEGNGKAYCLEPICLPGCNTTHGYCKRPNECLCRSGWRGELCDKCQTFPGCSHGTCENIFECNCDPGWGGMFCNLDLNYCTHHKPCKNGARCANVGQGSFSCECPHGFTGRHCEFEMNECDPNPCKNGAKCTIQEVGHTCECPENFFGPSCESTHVTCATNPCKNGGTCDEGLTQYRCRCKPGFRGVNCEIEDARCSSTSCLNGGTCRDAELGYSCSCAPGFSGRRCQKSVGKCDRNTCKNNGRCISISDGIRCECRPGYAGPRCELLSNPCDQKPCQNGGVCAQNNGSYKCHCTSRFEGQNCEKRAPCYANPCKNGGKCLNLGKAYRCTCETGYEGRTCEIPTSRTSDALHDSYDDTQNTRIIVLTKNEKSGLNTAQWIAVCFGSAFLLLVFIAVAICIAYQRHGKSPYISGRVMRNVPLPLNLESRNQSGETVSDPTSTGLYSPATPTKQDLLASDISPEMDTYASEVVVVPTGTISPAAKSHYASRSTEILNPVVEKQHHERREKRASTSSLSRQKRPGHAHSHSDVRCAKSHEVVNVGAPSRPADPAPHDAHRSRSFTRARQEESLRLPTYQEACNERRPASQIV